MHDATTPVANTNTPKRRNHTAQFKAHVIALCQQPHVSMASVARTHDLNANLLRRWVSDHQRQRARRPDSAVPESPWQTHVTEVPSIPDPSGALHTPGFIALSSASVRMTSAAAQRPAPVTQTEPVQVELTVGAWHVRVHWPGPRLDALAPWLRELMA